MYLVRTIKHVLREADIDDSSDEEEIQSNPFLLSQLQEVSTTLKENATTNETIMNLQKQFIDNLIELVSIQNNRLSKQSSLLEQLSALVSNARDALKTLDSDYTNLVEQYAQGNVDLKHGILEELRDQPSYINFHKIMQQIVALENEIGKLSYSVYEELPVVDDPSTQKGKEARKIVKKMSNIIEMIDEEVVYDVDTDSLRDELLEALNYYSDVDQFLENVENEKEM